jgi:O-antigen/teichoic acid export membrane protein
MILKQSATYMAASLVAALTGVASVAIFTRMLSPAEYGVYAIAMAKAATAAALLFTWLRLSILRFQSEGGDVDLRRTALLSYFASALLVPVAVVLLPSLSAASTTVVAATIVYTQIYSLFDIGQETLRARQLVPAYVQAAIVRSCIALLLGGAAVAVFGGGLAVILSAALAYLVAVLFQVRSAWAAPHAPFDKATLRKMFSYGAPLTAAGLATTVHMVFDRLALGYFQDSAAAGQFAAIADFTRQCVALPVAGVFSAIVPAIMQIFARGDATATRRQLSGSGELLIAGVLPTAAGLMIVTPHLAVVVFGAEYQAAAETVMPILAIAWTAHLISQQYVHLSFHMAEKPHLLVAHSVALVFFSFCFISVGAKYFGIMGTAYGLVASEFFGFLLAVYLTRFGHPLPAFLGGVARVIAATAVMAAITLGVRAIMPWQPGIGPLLLLSAVGAGTYAAAAVALNVAGLRGSVTRFLQRRVVRV